MPKELSFSKRVSIKRMQCTAILILLSLYFHVLCFAKTPPPLQPEDSITGKDEKSDLKDQHVSTQTNGLVSPRISIYARDLFDLDSYCPNGTFDAEIFRSDFKGKMVRCSPKEQQSADTESDVLSNEKREKLIKEILPSIVATYTARALVKPFNELFKIPSFTSSDVCSNFNIPNDHYTKGVPEKDIIIYVAAAPMPEQITTDPSIWAEVCPTKNGNPIVLVMNFNPKRILTDSDLLLNALKEMDNVLKSSTSVGDKTLVLREPLDALNTENSFVNAKCKENSKVDVKGNMDSEWTQCDNTVSLQLSGVNVDLKCESALHVCVNTHSHGVYSTLHKELRKVRISTSTDTLYDEDTYCPEDAQDENTKRSTLFGSSVVCTKNIDTKVSDALTQEKREYLLKTVLPQVIEKYRMTAPRIRPVNEPKKILFERSSRCSFFDIPQNHIKYGINETDVMLYISAAPMPSTDSEGSVWAERCTTVDNQVIAAVINFNPKKIQSNVNIVTEAIQAISKALGTSFCPQRNALFLPATFPNETMSKICFSVNCEENQKVILGLSGEENKWKECSGETEFILNTEKINVKCPSYNDICTSKEAIVDQEEDMREEVGSLKGNPNMKNNTRTTNDAVNKDNDISMSPEEAQEEMSSTSPDPQVSVSKKENKQKTQKEGKENTLQQKGANLNITMGEESKKEARKDEKSEACSHKDFVCIEMSENEEAHLRSKSLGSPQVIISTSDLDSSNNYCPSTDDGTPTERSNLKGGTSDCTLTGNEYSDALTEEKKTELIEKILPLVKERVLNRTLIHKLKGTMKLPTFASQSVCSRLTIPANHTTDGVNDTDIILYVSAAPMEDTEVNLPFWVEQCPTENNQPIVIAMNFNPRKILTKMNIVKSAADSLLKTLGVMHSCENGKSLILRTHQAFEKSHDAHSCLRVKCEDGHHEQVQRNGEKTWKECMSSSDNATDKDDKVADPNMCEVVRDVCLNSHNSNTGAVLSRKLNSLRIHPSYLDLEEMPSICQTNVITTYPVKGESNLSFVYMRCYQEDDPKNPNPLTKEKVELLKTNVVPRLISSFENNPLFLRRKKALKVPIFDKESICTKFIVPNTHRRDGFNDTDVVLYVAAAPVPLHNNDASIWAEPCAFIKGRVVAVALNFYPESIKDDDATVRAAQMEVSKALQTETCPKIGAVLLRATVNDSSKGSSACVSLKCSRKEEVYVRLNDNEEWKKCTENIEVKKGDKSLSIQCPKYSDVCQTQSLTSDADLHEYTSEDDDDDEKTDVKQTIHYVYPSNDSRVRGITKNEGWGHDRLHILKEHTREDNSVFKKASLPLTVFALIYIALFVMP